MFLTVINHRLRSPKYRMKEFEMWQNKINLVKATIMVATHVNLKSEAVFLVVSLKVIK